jgi:hypothetical protein
MQPSTLRPLRINEVLDSAIRLYRTQFLLLIAVSGIALLPLTLLQLFLTGSPVQPLIGTSQNILILPLITSALTAAGVSSYQRQSWSLTTAYQEGWKYYRSVLGATLLEGLIMALPLIVIGVGIGIVAGLVFRGSQPVIIGMLLIAIVPIVLFFYTKYAVTFPAIIAEGVGATTGMSRSWKLTTGHFWHTLGVMVATSLLTILLSLTPAFLLGFIAQVAPSIAAWAPTMNILITQLSLLLMLPLQYLIATCLYYDLRIRNEGYDLEQAAQSYASSPPTPDLVA